MIHKAKKSLGQNFLKSEKALNEMCEKSDLNDKDIVLEIGPGKGALTKKLLEKVSTVIAIEKDDNLFIFLKEKFTTEIEDKRLILKNEDILDFDLNKIKSYKVIANIPYNITGLIIRKFLTSKNQPSQMTLLVQKEVAERIVARDKKESILSLSVKAYGNPSYIMKVHKRFFSPSPKVDSAIITIKDIGRNNFNSEKEEILFFELIKSGFAHKRKILRKNLETLNISPEKISQIFKKLEIKTQTRAEELKMDTWIKITEELL